MNFFFKLEIETEENGGYQGLRGGGEEVLVKGTSFQF